MAETSLSLLLLLLYLLLIIATLAIWFILTYRPAREKPPRRQAAPQAPEPQESQRPQPQVDPAVRRHVASKPLGAPSKRTIDDPFSAFRRSKRDDEF